jgi:hypothetical protein
MGAALGLCGIDPVAFWVEGRPDAVAFWVLR